MSFQLLHGGVIATDVTPLVYQNLSYARNSGTTFIQATSNDKHAFSKTDPFSLSFWFFAEDLSPLQTIIAKWSTTGFNRGYSVNLFNSNLYFDLIADNGAAERSQIKCDQVLTANTWYHVVATYNGNEDVSGMKLYIDGVEPTRMVTKNSLSSSPNDILAPDDPLTLFARDVNGNSILVGGLNEVKIYDVELSSIEVQEITNSGNATLDLRGTSTFEDTTGWYLLGDHPDDNSSNAGTIFDASRNANLVVSGNDLAFEFNNQRVIDLDRGSIQYIRASNNVDFNFATGAFSAFMWVFPDEISASNTDLIGKVESGQIGWQIFSGGFGAGRLVAAVRSSPTDVVQSVADNQTLFAGQWQHIGITWDGINDLKIYVNATEVAQAVTVNGTVGDISNTGKFGIGRLVDAGNDPLTGWHSLDGRVVQPALFTKELSAGEVTALYNAANPQNLSQVSDIYSGYHCGIAANDTSPNVEDVVGDRDLELINGASYVGEAYEF